MTPFCHRHKKCRSKADFAPTWHVLTKKMQVLERENGPSGPRAGWRVNSRPAAGNCAGAALPTPSIEIPKGEAAFQAAKPKKKDTL